MKLGGKLSYWLIALGYWYGVDVIESTQNKIQGFEDLKCWPAARELRLFVSKQIIPVMPNEEKYRLCDQILRAARSITANLAEGYGRFHYKDNAKFCSNSRGSCWEVLDHLITAHDEGMIPDEVLAKGRNFVSVTVKLINGYMKYLKQARPETNNH